TQIPSVRRITNFFEESSKVIGRKITGHKSGKNEKGMPVSGDRGIESLSKFIKFS
ncbi:MAG: hypothetical protein ACI8VT_003140, partial [Saprospiraceae bacterium]